jgi:hypothetical protein
VVFDLRSGRRHDPTFDREKEWTIVPRSIQIPVIRSKIGEVGLVGRARRESARLNGKTRASGVSSFSFFFHYLPLSSFSPLAHNPFLPNLFLSRVEYDN